MYHSQIAVYVCTEHWLFRIGCWHCSTRYLVKFGCSRKCRSTTWVPYVRIYTREREYLAISSCDISFQRSGYGKQYIIHTSHAGERPISSLTLTTHRGVLGSPIMEGVADTAPWRPCGSYQRDTSTSTAYRESRERFLSSPLDCHVFLGFPLGCSARVF